MDIQGYGEQSALKLWLKRKIHLCVSGSTVEMLPIPLSLIFKLFAWKALSKCFQLWRCPCINSSEELPLLGVQMQRLVKSSATSFWMSSHTMTVGTKWKGQPRFNNITICRRSLQHHWPFPQVAKLHFPQAEGYKGADEQQSETVARRSHQYFWTYLISTAMYFTSL